MNAYALFVTGMQRSGTTLLERLIDLHPDASVLSQPFPLLFVEAKRDFLRGLGRGNVRYPLGHLFQEDGYRQEAFDRHLAAVRFDSARIGEIFEKMQGFSGQYTRFEPSTLEQVLPQLPLEGFAELIAGLYRALCPEPDIPIKGGKETICEEFLPYLLDHGWRCVVILRDPRDVVASLNHGRGPQYGGQLKPTLFNVRNWRKSVAYALHLEGRQGFLWLRYEDVVADPRAAMRRITQAFGLTDLESREIRGWSGNSSHGERSGVSAESIGAYRRVLPEAVARFVEASCLPEMQLLGYATTLAVNDTPSVLRDFEEPYEITREGIECDLASEANAALEARRLELLAERPDAILKPWFLFERTHARLREAFRT